MRAGDWASSVPALARLDVRIGHPTAWTSNDALERVSAVIDRRRARKIPGSASTLPQIRPSGLPCAGPRARPSTTHSPGRSPTRTRRRTERGLTPYALGARPTLATYLNQIDTPAICYGPTARRTSTAIDEAVELASIVGGARTLARFIASVVRERGRAAVTVASDPERRWLAPGVTRIAPSAPTILEPVRMRSAGEHIADRIVTAIALGEFVPGQRAADRTGPGLDAERSAGRTVREAIQRLAALGYVDVRRGRNGGRVRPARVGGRTPMDMIRRTLLPGWDRFERLFDFRQLIEPLIARTAAERRTAGGCRVRIRA